jgi:hypothetical protein
MMRRFILTILILAVLALIVAIATGFLNLNTSGQLRAPSVEVKAQGGELPKIDVDTEQVVVGTTNSTLAVPEVGIRNSTVRVPTVAVKDDEAGAQKK